MSQAPGLSPDRVHSVSALARALLAAARNWTMYPETHPAVRESLERLAQTIDDCTSGVECSLGVTPDMLLLKGEPLPASPPLSEAARFLHERDILRLDLAQGVTLAALNDLVALLSLDTETRRERGGPAAAWAHAGHASISIEQIDYRRVLEDRDVVVDLVHRDEIWHSIVKSIVHGRLTFDEVAQQRLLEVARDPALIAELTRETIAPKCAADGSPMIASQAATVIAAYRHLADIVSVMDPDRLDDCVKNLAGAAMTLDPKVLLHVLQTDEDPKAGLQVVGSLADAFDDTNVARLLAMTLAVDGQASDRLAEVFNTIAPDEARRQRVLRMTRDMLAETDFGKGSQFTTLWTSMETLLLSYNEKPYVAEQYRNALDGAGARGSAMARELPPEAGEWIKTLDQANIRQLSVTMAIDLLGLAQDREGAAAMAHDLEVLAEHLLLEGDVANAARITAALAASAQSTTFMDPVACREALGTLARSATFVESVNGLGELAPVQFDDYRKVCADVGPAAVDALIAPMTTEDESLRRRRAADIIVAFGVPALPHIAPLLSDDLWFVQLNGVMLLDRISAPEAVPLLQPLLRRADPRVTPRVVAALAGINDPAAARAIHTVLRSVTGDLRRAVIAALVEERDQRVVPMLLQILGESEPLGRDHVIVLDTMGALATLDGKRAVPPIATLIRRTRWFAPRRKRALKRRGVQLLLQIGSPAASRVLADCRIHGDRLLRRIIHEAQPAAFVEAKP